MKTLREQVEEIIYGEIDHNMGSNGDVINKLLALFEKEMKKIIDMPLRSGDGLEDDEIVPDGIQEAFVRQEQRNKLAEKLK